MQVAVSEDGTSATCTCDVFAAMERLGEPGPAGATVAAVDGEGVQARAGNSSSSSGAPQVRGGRQVLAAIGVPVACAQRTDSV